jgi:hypothetical protein
LREFECGGLGLFHVRSRGESASPLPRKRRTTDQT